MTKDWGEHMNSFLSNVLGSAIAIILGGVVTPAIINWIKSRTKDIKHKHSMLEACLEEIHSNLEDKTTEITEIANTVFGRTTYVARQIIDLGILDVVNDRKLLLLLVSILKKEDDLRQRANIIFSRYIEFQAHLLADYANPSMVSTLTNVAAQMMKKPSVQETFMDGYRKIVSEQVQLSYEQLKELYRLTLDELNNNYTKGNSRGVHAINPDIENGT